MKSQVIPLSKEEMDKLMNEIQKEDEFDYMIFSVLKTTGRRLGEIYGIEELKKIDVKKIGTKTIYIDGEKKEVDRNISVYKKTGKTIYGVKLKDIDFEKGIMKVWVLKRRQFVQDESILMPEAVRLISAYARKNKLNLEDYVFRKTGRGYRQIENVIKTYAKKVGITHNVVVHNFRHFFVTELKRQGWTDDKIRKLTGHKNVQSLSSYDHIVASDLKDEAIRDIKNF